MHFALTASIALTLTLTLINPNSKLQKLTTSNSSNTWRAWLPALGMEEGGARSGMDRGGGLEEEAGGGGIREEEGAPGGEVPPAPTPKHTVGAHTK